MRTQIRGVVMVEFNEIDFQLIAQGALHALRDYNPDSEFGYEALIADLGDDLKGEETADARTT